MLGRVIAKALRGTCGTASWRAVSGSIVTSRISATRHLLSAKVDTELARGYPPPDAGGRGIDLNRVASIGNVLSCGKGRRLNLSALTQSVHQALRVAWTGRTSVRFSVR